MSRRRARADDGDVLSLDSFLDIVTNVVGVLILIAVVTVLSAGDISISSSASALASPSPTAERVLFECARGQLFFVDEEGNAHRIRMAMEEAESDVEPESDERVKLDDVYGDDAEAYGDSYDPTNLVPLLARKDVGDKTHRVRAQALNNGMAWVYQLRDDARGLTAEQIEAPDFELEQRFERIARDGGFVYFVVHDDSFEVFRAARELAQAVGVKSGWHPVEGDTPLKLSARGNLGKRIQ